MFIHAVYFWLKDNLIEQEKNEFIKGVNSLITIESVNQGYIGIPANTDREIIDRSYSYALTLVFTDQTAHDLYQTHPVHDRFRETCAGYWRKVLIYDSISKASGLS